MLPFLVPGLMSLGGAILNKIGGSKRDKQNAEAGRADFEKNANARAARARLLQGILRGYGIEGLLGPELMGKLTTPQQYVPGAGQSPNTLEFLGGILGQSAPYMPRGGSPGGNMSRGTPGPSFGLPPITMNANMGNLAYPDFTPKGVPGVDY